MSYQHPDQLLPLYGTVKRAKFAVVDIETKSGVPGGRKSQKRGFTRPFMAGYYDGQRYYQTVGDGCLGSMAGFLLRPEADGMVYYAHNGGGFDWLHFLPHIVTMGYAVEIMAVSSTIMMLRVKDPHNLKRKGWRFLDSFKLIPTSLAKAARSFAAETQKLTLDLDTHETDPRWGEYLRADCISLYQVVTRFHDLVELKLQGEVGITAASTAMRTFRRAYQSAPIERHSEHHAMFRAAYKGGRTEIHQRSQKGLHYYDINSCYPHVMRSPMPVGRLIRWGAGLPGRGMRDACVGFCEARVTIPETTLVPCLPVTDATTGRLTFPVGRLLGTWDYCELERAGELGATVEYLSSVWIQAKPILGRMVEDLYQYRNKSRADYDQGLSEVAKILLNATYGKFGQKADRETLIVLGDSDIPPDGARMSKPNDPDCRVCYLAEVTDAPYMIPQIAAHVTALSRIHLHKYLTIASDRGVLAYCDTDSILTTADMSDLCGSELGMIKDEGAGVVYDGEFLQPKLYCLMGNDGSSKVAMKGYRPEDSKIGFTRAEFLRAQAGDVISFEVLEKLGSMAQNSFREAPRMRTITRQVRTQDEKRVYLSDGSTRPLTVRMW